MRLRDHFHSFLDSVRQEDRYRIFTDLERHADRHPTPPGAAGESRVRSSSGARTIISGWDATLLSSMRCLRPRCGLALALEGPATSPAIATRS